MTQGPRDDLILLLLRAKLQKKEEKELLDYFFYSFL